MLISLFTCFYNLNEDNSLLKHYFIMVKILEGLPPRELEARYHGKPVKRHLYEFGVLWSCVALIAAFYCIWTGEKQEIPLSAVYLSFSGALFISIGIFLRKLYLHPWRIWMLFGHVLGLIVTPIVLTVLWIVFFIPTSFIIKSLGIKPLDMRFRDTCQSYWIRRDIRKDDFQLLSRQF
jgi:hypothetical protein